MGNIQALFTAFFNVLSINFTIGSYSFSLLDVVIASLILYVIGLFFAKIILFMSNQR